MHSLQKYLLNSFSFIDLNPFKHFGQSSEQQQKESSDIKHETEWRDGGNKIQKTPPDSQQSETVPHSS